MDDLVISGPAHVLVEILEFLRSDLMVLRRGLTIRPDKCCIFMPNQGVPDGLRVQYDIPADIQLVTMDGGVTALGVPLGSDDYVERFMTDIAASVKQLGDELEALEHGQLELLLHTYSGGLNRVMYLFRCLPSESLGTVSRVCNEESARLLQRLTAPASSVTDAMTAQAHLPRRYGGLGLADVQHVGNAAFIAATLAALPQDGNASVTLARNLEFTTALTLYNKLVNPKDRASCDSLSSLKPAERTQKALVKRVHDHQFDLLASNMTQQDLARLKEQTSCGASSWLQPTFVSGNPVISANVFPLLVVRYLGGEFQARAPLPCPRRGVPQHKDRVPCQALVDSKLSHVTNSCKALLTERHKTLASALQRICNEAGRATSTEVQCIPGSLSVPADVYIYINAPNTKPIAVDVAVVSPAGDSWSAKPGQAVGSEEERKLRNFAEDLKNAQSGQGSAKSADSPVDFVPFVISSYGLLGQKARAFISFLASGLCARWIWSIREAQEYIRRVVLASVFAFMGRQMLTTLNGA
ncbi:MAG: hypothetical protein ACAH88_04375 [Roseimicrobium sp.]